ncbi:MAG: FAD:protein FMN transferase, partial [Povalibacter sp.]
TRRVLRLARAMMRASEGLFDCTVGGELIERGCLPRHDGSSHARSGVADDIEINGSLVRVRGDIRITLDGIAKGYGVDMGIRALRRCGVSAGWINAGGDLRAFGEIALPVYRRESDGALCALGGIKDAAVATSATHASGAERYPGVIVSSQRDVPKQGIWTVVAHTAWRADALTKVAALAASADRSSIVQRLGGRLVEERLAA